MVGRTAWQGLVLLAGLALGAPSALALFSQTASDLEVLEDALRQAAETDPNFTTRAAPVLLATPVHLWRESRNDFAAAATKTLTAVFTAPNAVINCPDCDAWRLHVREGKGLDIDNGELSLSELGSFKQDPRYGKARTVAYIEETAAGVELRLIDLTDGRIVYSKLADSTARLSDINPYLHLQQEADRRLRGEALTYVFINIGLYPTGLFQIEYLEQWGDRNQYITGVSLSLFNPNFALGITGHYMVPKLRKLQLVAALYLPLQNALQSTVKNGNPTSTFVAQGMVEYAFGSTFGVFAAVASNGGASVGINLYNPILMPFLL